MYPTRWCHHGLPFTPWYSGWMMLPHVKHDHCCVGRSAHRMAKCNGSIYLLGGYGGDAAFPSDVLTLPVNTFAASGANQQPALPQPVDAVVEEAPAR